jgi:hypothetical protein
LSFKTGEEVMNEIESILSTFFHRMIASGWSYYLWDDASHGETWIPEQNGSQTGAEVGINGSSSR